MISVTAAMIRSGQRLAMVAACLTTATLAATAQQPSFTTSSDLVVVPAVVVDRKGGLVRGLDAGMFQVFEDGKPVAVESFVAPDEQGSGMDGRLIVLVLDNVGTPVELGPRVKTIARKFVDRMSPADRLSAITLDGGRSSGAGTAKEARAAIERFTPAFGDSIRSNAQNVQHGLQMIGSLAQQLSPVEHRRKVMVFIGSAAMFSPSADSAFSDRGAALHPEYFDAIRITGQENVTVYVIDPEGFGNGVGVYDESFAEQTGGKAWVNTNNFDRAINQIWQESGSYYLLGYRPPINDHRLHKIDVRVTVPNTTVRARKARG